MSGLRCISLFHLTIFLLKLLAGKSERSDFNFWDDVSTFQGSTLSTQANLSSSPEIKLCDSKYLKGNCRSMKNPRNITCINLGAFDDSKIFLRKHMMSIGLNGHCVVANNNYGCDGEFKMLSPGLEERCQLALSTCWHHEIKSLRTCDAIFAAKYSQPIGSRGPPCKTECATRNNSFFWCNSHDGSRDYCFPRLGQHFLAGVDCKGNTCTHPQLWNSSNVLLYNERDFQGPAMEVLRNKDDCMNTLQMENEIHSISINNNCIVLYSEIGCTGATTRLDMFSDWEAFRNLSKLGTFNPISSISHCNANLPGLSTQSVGFKGGRCLNLCRSYGKPYFWCYVTDNNWDFCSPRNGQDYLGNICNTSCHTPDYNNRTGLSVLYEHTRFTGRNVTLDYTTAICYNLPSWNFSKKSLENLSTSIDHKGVCLELYDDIGCTGHEISKSPNSTKVDAKFGHVTSLKYCTTTMPSFYTSPRGSRGEKCRTSCETRGASYFWCDLNSQDAWDFCSSRRGTNYFGDSCEDNCDNSVDRPYKISLYGKPDHQSFSHKIEYDQNRICYNLVEANISEIIPLFKHGVGSLKLFGNCAKLYTNIGCYGDFAEFIPNVLNHCQTDTNQCFPSNNWLSVRFCTTELPALCEDSFAINGLNCKDTCRPNRSANFSCTTVNNTMEVCIPRPNVDTTGQFNCSSCHCTKMPYAEFYTRTEFSKSSAIIKRDDDCHNIKYGRGSIKLNGIPCLRLFYYKSCYGKYWDLKSSNLDCQRDISSCEDLEFIPDSFIVCEHSIPQIQTGITGMECTWGCQVNSWIPGVFTCRVSTDLFDFCNPTRYRNHLGETCNQDNCVSKKSNVSYPCSMKSNRKSSGLCETYRPQTFHIARGLCGTLCQDSCETKGKNYFWCHLNDGSEDKCLPRPGVGYSGEDCKPCVDIHESSMLTTTHCVNECKNWSIELTENETIQTDKITLFTLRYFQGRNITLHNITQRTCISFTDYEFPHNDFDDEVSSIALNGNCIYIYDEFGCEGDYTVLRPNEEDQCQLALSLCDWNKQISSLRHCQSSFPNKFVKPSGSRGLPCKNKCKMRSRSYFNCKLEDGSEDYCYPRPGQHFLGTDCRGQNCSNPAFWSTENVVVYKHWYFQGAALEISFENPNNCVNLHQHYFDDSISSLNIKNHCVNLYVESGCHGRYSTFTSSRNKNCFRYLAHCHDTTVLSSISLCNAEFPSPRRYNFGLRGEPCVSECGSARKSYFWCKLGDGLWDFCSPRPGQDYLGEFCNNETCAQPDYTSNYMLPVLYEHEGYHGMNFTLEDIHSTRCYNLRFWNNTAKNFDRRTSSIDHKGYCLELYSDIGCTGESKTLGSAFNVAGSHLDSTDMHDNLIYAEFDDETVSLKLCNTSISQLSTLVNGSRGGACATRCETRGKNFFWCKLRLHNAWDFCSPRIDTDYFGDDCTDDCNHNYRRYRVTLYNQTYFQGAKFDMEYDDNKICHNLLQSHQHIFLKGIIASIELNGNCAVLYSDIGCTGTSLEFVPTVDEDCQKDIRRCTPEAISSWSSIRFCTTELPSVCQTSLSAAGLRCQTACQPSESSFTCKVLYNNRKEEEDECFPRNEINSSGEFKCSSCKCFEERHVILHSGTHFSGNRTVVYQSSITNMCTNVDYDDLRHSNLHSEIRSVSLIGIKCIHLYSSLGCTGHAISLNAATSLECLGDIGNYTCWGQNNCTSDFPCNASERHYSLSLCADDFKSLQRKRVDKVAWSPVSISGFPCISCCNASGHYFTCNISIDMKDFCRPSVNQNHIGQSCVRDNCVFQK